MRKTGPTAPACYPLFLRSAGVDPRQKGQNEPCPCGSEKFKCCGADVAVEEQGVASQKSRLGKEPSLDEWRALYEAAEAFKRPGVGSGCAHDLFEVMDPETGIACAASWANWVNTLLWGLIWVGGLQSIFDMAEKADDYSRSAHAKVSDGFIRGPGRSGGKDRE